MGRASKFADTVVVTVLPVKIVVVRARSTTLMAVLVRVKVVGTKFVE